MRRTLVMDTCGAAGYVGLCGADAVRTAEAADVVERHLPARATQEQLLPAVGEVLAQASVRLGELSAIAVVSGPGSFTGVRIGLATAKGLCEAQAVPLVTLSRLEVLAQAWRSQALSGPGEVPADGDVWTWLDAGRGEVYAACARAGARGVEGERLLPVQEAMALAGATPVAVCEERLLQAAPTAVLVAATVLERALREAALHAVEAQRWADVALSDAHYVRVPDAELALRARQG